MKVTSANDSMFEPVVQCDGCDANCIKTRTKPLQKQAQVTTHKLAPLSPENTIKYIHNKQYNKYETNSTTNT